LENINYQKLLNKWYNIGFKAGKKDKWMDVENTIKDTYKEGKFEDPYNLVYTDLEQWEQTDHFNLKYVNNMSKDIKIISDDERIDIFTEIKNKFWDGFLVGREKIGIDIFKIAKDLIKKEAIC